MDEELEPVKMPLLKELRLMAYFNLMSFWFWLHHAAAVHVLRLVFCPHCSGYFNRAIVIGRHDELGDDVFCENCYVRTFGRGI